MTAANVVGVSQHLYLPVARYTADVFEQGAKNGDPEALWSYAYCLRMGGEHTGRNEAAAHSWFKQAVAALIPLANAGDAKAQYRLGLCYKKGYGCESASPAVASQWFSLATPGLKVLAEEGDPKAANYYGALQVEYSDLAVYWKEEAARQGHAPAHMYLANKAFADRNLDKAAFHILEAMRQVYPTLPPNLNHLPISFFKKIPRPTHWNAED